MKKIEKNKASQTPQKSQKIAEFAQNYNLCQKSNKKLHNQAQMKTPPQGLKKDQSTKQINNENPENKNSLQFIPLYIILKLQNLEQYAQVLISKGYGYDLKQFSYLNNVQLEQLFNEVGVVPNDKSKLKNLIDLIINDMNPKEREDKNNNYNNNTNKINNQNKTPLKNIKNPKNSNQNSCFLKQTNNQGQPNISSNKNSEQKYKRDQQNLISDYYESEKNNLSSIPLYRILKLQNLQQYARELISRGFGYDLKKFNYLNNQQLDNLFYEIRVQPAYKNKLKDLIDLITSDMIPEIENNSMWNMQAPKNYQNNKNNLNLAFGQSWKESIKNQNFKYQESIMNNNPSQIQNDNQTIKKQQKYSTKRSISTDQQSTYQLNFNFQKKNQQTQTSSTAPVPTDIKNIQPQQRDNKRNNYHKQYQKNYNQIKSQSSDVNKLQKKDFDYEYFFGSDKNGQDEFEESMNKLIQQYFSDDKIVNIEKEKEDELHLSLLNTVLSIQQDTLTNSIEVISEDLTMNSEKQKDFQKLILQEVKYQKFLSDLKKYCQ